MSVVRSVVATALLMVAVAAPVASATAGVLTHELALLPGSLESLSPTALIYRDPDGVLRDVPRDQLVRWSRPSAVNRSGEPRSDTLRSTLTASHLITTDGQAWLGRLAPDANEAEALGWATPGEGSAAVPVPLNRIKSVRLVRGKLLAMPAANPDAPKQDRVLLQGGQVVAGFLVGFTPESVQLILDGTDDPIDIPLDTVHLLELANPNTPPLPGTDYAHLTDGQRHAFRNLRTEADRFVGQRIGLDDRAADVSIDRPSLSRIDFHADGQRLVPLADLPARIDQPAVVFGVPYPPALNADTADLHAPLQITFELPDGTVRFAARLELDQRGLSPAAARWADLTVRVSSPVLTDTTSPDTLSFRLNADHPTARLNLPINAGPLTLTLDPAANGPILDRLRLTQAHALIQSP